MTTALTIALDLAERYARSAAVGARQYGYTDDLRDAEADLATIAKLRLTAAAEPTEADVERLADHLFGAAYGLPPSASWPAVARAAIAMGADPRRLP